MISNKCIIAMGSDIKNRPLAGDMKRMYIGADIGDLSDAGNFEKFHQEIKTLAKKMSKKPGIIACDLHPGYFSTQFARQKREFFADSHTIIPVQHHHAHIASVLLEQKTDGPVIGVSFDGTGYGADGNMWGGEFLLVNGGSYTRLAHLKYRKMPGGDVVVREPWRMVLSILGSRALPFLKKVSKNDIKLVMSMLNKNINAPLTSSAGRIFDAAAALMGLCAYAQYEAEGPIKLEALCRKNITQKYPFIIRSVQGSYIIDTDAVFEGMMRDIKKGRHVSFIATVFHNTMVEIIVQTVRLLSKKHTIRKVALSGGVFQNKYLISHVVERLKKGKYSVLTNKQTPVNDLNISMGQYYVSSKTGKN